MLTRFRLQIGTDRHELSNDCIRNWDDIECVFKRTDYSGVAQSFTTQFEFVGEAYDLLLALYLKDGYNAEASITVYTITNEWDWEERFSCPLDFSSVNWTGTTLKINAVDNGLAALIKAEKSTKYEFLVGEDIKSDGAFTFDRLPMQESVTYALTSGESDDDSAEITISHNHAGHLWVGNIGDEITVGGAIHWQDDQTEELDSYLLQAVKDVEVDFQYDVSFRSDQGSGFLHLYLQVLRNGADVTSSVLTREYDSTSAGYMGLIGKTKSGGNHVASLPDIDEKDSAGNYKYHSEDVFVIYQGTVWRPRYMGHAPYWEWINEGTTPEELYIGRIRNVGKWTLKLQKNDKVVITPPVGTGTTSVRVCSSRFVFSWKARGEAFSIPTFNPLTACDAILKKICSGQINATAYISPYDSRLSNTRIMAAESIRGINGAKFYSSFNEFVDWMETVFGYTYYLGKPKKSKLTRTAGPATPFYVYYPDRANPGETLNAAIEEVFFDTKSKKFLVRDSNYKFYAEWYDTSGVFGGSENYNADHDHPRTDTLFEFKAGAGYEEGWYYFDESDPIKSLYGPESISSDRQQVCFVHRSELFDQNANVKAIDYAREAQYSVEASGIYSSVQIGYDKKDYESINGRDEFNFNITYSTGCPVSDKKLSLISKYRADCYGIEFTAQKRGQDTTDSDSDQTVFFVLAKKSGSALVPDRSLTIENALSDAVFNGAFSPMACVAANAGFISKQANNLKLAFASSTGNSNIVIGGQSMSGDITLGAPLFTCGTLEFSTGDTEPPIDINDIVEVTSGGVTYQGFVKEVSFKYAKSEAVKYKLIVKSITND